MKNEQNKFLNTLDEMEIKMPKMSEEKIQRILKLELEKAGLNKTQNIKSKHKTSRLPKFRFVAGLVAACLVLVISITSIKETDISSKFYSDNIPGGVLTDPNKQSEELPIISTSINNNPSNPAEAQQPDNNEQIKEIFKDLDFTVYLPSKMPQGYKQSSVTTVSNKLIVLYEKANAEIRIEAISSSEIMGTSSLPTNNVRTITVKDLTVTLTGSENLYTFAEWEHNDVTYTISSSKGLTEDEITQIISNLKKIEKS